MRKLYAVVDIYEEGKAEPLIKGIEMIETNVQIIQCDVGIGCRDVAPITRHEFLVEVLTVDSEKGV